MRERRRAELHAELDRRGGCARPRPRGPRRRRRPATPNLYVTAPSPVVDGLSWNVFEFIASNAEPERLGVLRAAPPASSRLVPRHVQADRPVRAGQRVERGDVVELLLDRARLAAAGKRPKRVPPVPSAHEGAATLKRAHLVDRRARRRRPGARAAPSPRASACSCRSCPSASSVAIVSAFSCTATPPGSTWERGGDAAVDGDERAGRDAEVAADERGDRGGDVLRAGSPCFSSVRSA